MNEIKKIKKLYNHLLSTEEKKFLTHGRVEVTNEHGVYIIFSTHHKVLHVGKTSRGKNGLNQRLYNHINNRSTFSKEYLKKNGKILRMGYKFQYLEIKNARTRALLEALTTGMLCPAHIGTGEKRID